MINPGSIYEYDLENGETKTLKTKEVLGAMMQISLSLREFGQRSETELKYPYPLFTKKELNWIKAILH